MVNDMKETSYICENEAVAYMQIILTFLHGERHEGNFLHL